MQSTISDWRLCLFCVVSQQSWFWAFLFLCFVSIPILPPPPQTTTHLQGKVITAMGSGYYHMAVIGWLWVLLALHFCSKRECVDTSSKIIDILPVFFEPKWSSRYSHIVCKGGGGGQSFHIVKTRLNFTIKPRQLSIFYRSFLAQIWRVLPRASSQTKNDGVSRYNMKPLFGSVSQVGTIIFYAVIWYLIFTRMIIDLQVSIVLWYTWGAPSYFFSIILTRKLVIWSYHKRIGVNIVLHVLRFIFWYFHILHDT